MSVRMIITKGYVPRLTNLRRRHVATRHVGQDAHYKGLRAPTPQPELFIRTWSLESHYENLCGKRPRVSLCKVENTVLKETHFFKQGQLEGEDAGYIFFNRLMSLRLVLGGIKLDTLVSTHVSPVNSSDKVMNKFYKDLHTPPEECAGG
ncbi:unnamed protein product [Schistocephalus solidus]|uniref:Mitochondrial ribosomal protein L5 n=1 Tax=Schistocephalus solidus TaxID=70667 RepID=A0A183SP09_SCHSO|nr:unnamed protein product [Schistocephalus solidus]